MWEGVWEQRRSLFARSRFRSSQDAAENREGLEQHNIRAILNVAFGREAFPGEFLYLNVPLLDEPGQSLATDAFEKALSFVSDCESKRVPVLVHCNAGISRSCSVCIAFLMRTQNLSFDQSLAIVRKARPAARPNMGFEQQLRQMEKRSGLL